MPHCAWFMQMSRHCGEPLGIRHTGPEIRRSCSDHSALEANLKSPRPLSGERYSRISSADCCCTGTDRCGVFRVEFATFRTEIRPWGRRCADASHWYWWPTLAPPCRRRRQYRNVPLHRMQNTEISAAVPCVDYSIRVSESSELPSVDFSVRGVIVT